MLLKKINTAMELRDEFRKYNRDQYVYVTYEALIEYYDSLEDQELDVIAICCELSEESYEYVYNGYDNCRTEVLEAVEIDEENINFESQDVKNAIVSWLEDNTSVLYIGYNFVSYWNF